MGTIPFSATKYQVENAPTPREAVTGGYRTAAAADYGAPVREVGNDAANCFRNADRSVDEAAAA